MDLNLGVMTALVSPFNKNGNVDEKAFVNLIETQIAAGVDSLLVLGGTGEVLSVPKPKRRELLDIAVKTVNKRIPVICGICELGVYDAVQDAIEAKETGVDYLLCATPFGGNTPVKGIIDFYRAVHAASQMPILIYNFPGRTGFNTTPAITRQIIDANVGIVGIKDCACKLEQTMEQVYMNGDKICVLSGNEDSGVWEILCGAKGAILASSNLYPEAWVKMFKLAKEHKIEELNAVANKFVPLNRVLFSEPNPAPLKYAMSLRGLDVGDPLLPIQPCSVALQEKLKAEMKALELI